MAVLARKGPGGWWRIAKNTARYLLRVQERPVSLARWTGMLTAAGFAEVTAAMIRAEAGLVTGRRPWDPVPSGHDGPPGPPLLSSRSSARRGRADGPARAPVQRFPVQGHAVDPGQDRG